MKYIDLKNVSLVRQRQTILRDISCTFESNQITTLIGPNGGGKTSLVKLILGIYKPTTGSVWEKKHLKMGYMPQRIHIDPAMPLKVNRFLKDTTLLAPLGAASVTDRDMSALSGGEMQRVLLAYALQNNPDVLILDEPAGGLDIVGENVLYRHILDYQRQTKCCLIMVSHDLHFVMKQTNRVLCIHQHICCSGQPEEIRADKNYQSLFGCQAFYRHHHDHCHDKEET